MTSDKLFLVFHRMAHVTNFFFLWLRRDLEECGCRTIAPEFKDPDSADWRSTKIEGEARSSDFVEQEGRPGPV
jgi:hypothetical protein